MVKLTYLGFVMIGFKFCSMPFLYSYFLMLGSYWLYFRKLSIKEFPLLQLKAKAKIFHHLESNILIALSQLEKVKNHCFHEVINGVKSWTIFDL